VWYRSGGLYVVGRDPKSGEIRTFAVDRIRRLEIGEDHFEVPESFDFDTYIGSSFGVIADQAVRVRILFEPGWATYVEERSWHDSQVFEKQPDGKIELRMDVGSTPDLRSWGLSFGSGAEVLEPEGLRAEVARWLVFCEDRVELEDLSPEIQAHTQPLAAGREPRHPLRRDKAAAPEPLAVTLSEVEQRVIASALARHGGNISQTARELGIDRNTLKRKLPRKAPPARPTKLRRPRS